MPNPGIEDYADELQSIIKKVKPSLTNEEKLQIREELSSFMANLPYKQEYLKIRRVAKSLSEKLRGEISEDIIAFLESEEEELAIHMGAMEAITNKADNDARVLRGETVKQIVKVATKVIASAKDAKKAIEKEDLPVAAKRVEAMVDSLTKLLADLNIDS